MNGLDQRPRTVGLFRPMTDELIRGLRDDLAQLRAEISELRNDIYSDSARRRVGVLERTERMEARQDDLEAFLTRLQRSQEEMEERAKRRDEERAQAEARRGRAVNLMFAFVTTILSGGVVAWFSMYVLGM